MMGEATLSAAAETLDPTKSVVMVAGDDYPGEGKGDGDAGELMLPLGDEGGDSTRIGLVPLWNLSHALRYQVGVARAAPCFGKSFLLHINNTL